MLTSIVRRTPGASRTLTTAVAQAASTTAVAKTPADGNEQQVNVASVSGAPADLMYRKVKIYQPAKTAMQSGVDNTRLWKIDFNTMARWENPLMGWASSGDYLQGTWLKFRTKEEAVAFAERQGWHYDVHETPEPKFRKKVYADNFKFIPGRLRIHKTK
ncbi:ndufs4 NADH dehydrogenase Fe-S protein subunit [Sorochytrium milnesiophthora]